MDHTVRLCLGPYGGPMGVAISYKRGTPVRRVDAAVRTAPNMGVVQGGWLKCYRPLPRLLAQAPLMYAQEPAQRI